MKQKIKLYRQKETPVMTNPLVSIIVPVYNAQNSVARCLESICGQTYQELEIIVLNDGSTDDSLTICNQFCAKDPRVTVVDKENEGLSITRNVGMRLAQGKYLQLDWKRGVVGERGE